MTHARTTTTAALAVAVVAMCLLPGTARAERRARGPT